MKEKKEKKNKINFFLAFRPERRRCDDDETKNNFTSHQEQRAEPKQSFNSLSRLIPNR